MRIFTKKRGNGGKVLAKSEDLVKKILFDFLKS